MSSAVVPGHAASPARRDILSSTVLQRRATLRVSVNTPRVDTPSRPGRALHRSGSVYPVGAAACATRLRLHRLVFLLRSVRMTPSYSWFGGYSAANRGRGERPSSAL